MPPGWGRAWLESPPLPAAETDTVRAYTRDGWRLSWAAPGGTEGHGCDIEATTGPVPGVLARELSVEAVAGAFWPAWVAAEAEAKALGQPILAWLRAEWPAAESARAGLEAVQVLRPGGLEAVASFARRPLRSGRTLPS